MTRPAKTDRPPSIAITRLGGMGGASIPGGSTAGGIPAGGTAGQVLTAGGSNGERYWGPNVRQITANSSNLVTGPDVNFAAGSNIILAVTSNTLTINSTGTGGGTTIITKDEGSTLSSAVTTLDFVGAGVTASGGGATTTVTISGGSGGWPMLEAHTASASATLDFTTFISSTYDDYLIELVSLVPATNDVQLRMRMGTGGGLTYDTGTNYGWSLWIFRNGGSAFNGADSAQAYIGLVYSSGATVGQSSTTTNSWSGHMRLFSPQSTALHKAVEYDGHYVDAEPFRLRVLGDGTYISTTAVTALRFYYDSGNIASGTIRIYGIPKT